LTLENIRTCRTSDLEPPLTAVERTPTNGFAYAIIIYNIDRYNKINATNKDLFPSSLSSTIPIYMLQNN